MDSRRSLLVIALLFISFLVYQQWQLDYHTPKPVVTEQVNSTSDVPTISASTSTADITTSQQRGRVVTLENDVFRYKLIR
ncbi:YidC/Oxa1 family membrane protein insertase [Pasteurella canis]|uniref:YidC/Oxa1 family membrane protein insertase n=1 Tax=Pasteurella canis TaxID=753 RepID=A0A379ES13_9PAST|nr:YidC/Oxa1 family membrane protein insertase [Pasteurella canis]